MYPLSRFAEAVGEEAVEQVNGQREATVLNRNCRGPSVQR